MNDPFELTPFDLSDPIIRGAFLKTRDEIAVGRGLLCFSSAWCDPVIWAHYSDKHRGLCLGFEVPEIQGNPDSDESQPVTYVSTPLSFPADFMDLSDAEKLAIVQHMLYTKYQHWAYEQEIRVWAPLQNEENGLHYLEFDEKLKLAEVIIGARSTVTPSSITRALRELGSEVKISRARAAHNKFEMRKE